MLAAAAGAAMLTGPAAADNNQWGSYHWPNDGSGVSLTLKHAFRDSAWKPFYTKAIGGWGNNSSSPLTLADGGPSNTDAKKCDPIAGQVLVCSAEYGYRGWLGVAQIWLNGDHIIQGTSKLNDSYYSLETYNTDGWRDLVMCQEIGHDFGLDHQDEKFDNYNLETCQDYTDAPDGGQLEPGGFNYGPPNRAPNADDYAMLNSISMYGSGHSDGGDGSGGDSGCNPRSPKCSGGQDAFTFREVGKPITTTSGVSSSDWGRAMSYDAAGRPDTFLLDLGNGRKKITHVFWVPGYRPVSANMHD